MESKVLVHSGCYNERTIHRVIYEQHKFISCSPIGQKSGIRKTARSGCGGSRLLGCRQPSSPGILIWQSRKRGKNTGRNLQLREKNSRNFTGKMSGRTGLYFQSSYIYMEILFVLSFLDFLIGF